MGETKNIRFTKLHDLYGFHVLKDWLADQGINWMDIQAAKIITIEIDADQDRGNVYLIMKRSELYGIKSREDDGARDIGGAVQERLPFSIQAG